MIRPMRGVSNNRLHRLVPVSLALGVPGSPAFVSQWWLAFTAFVGANLMQSALTKWCLMESILRKLGVESGC